MFDIDLMALIRERGKECAVVGLAPHPVPALRFHQDSARHGACQTSSLYLTGHLTGRVNYRARRRDLEVFLTARLLVVRRTLLVLLALRGLGPLLLALSI